MEKKNNIITRTALFIIIIYMYLIPNTCRAEADSLAVKGSFIQGWFCNSWSDERWQKEFIAMKEAGIDYLILQAISRKTSDGKAITYYPTSLPNVETSSGLGNGDMIGTCLKNAEAIGIKVFLGSSSNGLWWKGHGGDATWFYEQMNLDNMIWDEVWALYKNEYPNAFYGWYWSYEVDNKSFKDENQQAELIKGMNIQLDHINSMSKRLPFMWSPFMNSNNGTPEEYEQIWKNVFSKLHTSKGDIFAPQDCVGAGGLKLNEVANWFAALRRAVDTKAGLKFWANVENFGNSVSVAHLVSQMKIEQPYVENYITFSYNHYYSPNNTDPGYHLTYIDYLRNGEIETTPPSAPLNVSANLKSGGVIELKWNHSEDNIGICGYYVYSDNKQIYKSKMGLLNGLKELTSLDTSFIDIHLVPDTEYNYQVKAYDFAGNVSDFSTQVFVNTGNNIFLENIVSKDCSYTVSLEADSKYPDYNKKELTNGGYARTASIINQSWEGVYDAAKKTRDVVIDLGEEKSVQQFIGDYLYNSSSSVNLPAEVQVGVSMDNITYTDVCCLCIPSIQDDVKASAYKCINTLENSVPARYVRFSVTPKSAWTFTDEYEVRSSVVVGNESENALPQQYFLSQNYPNPFNPTTIIRYQLSDNGYVTLKIFDMLGREVKTLVQENQEAGNYDVLFDASSLSSGIYLYELCTGSFVSTKKMILLR